ncbi:hypothetical protein D3C81_2100430 [compost metagenome]
MLFYIVVILRITSDRIIHVTAHNAFGSNVAVRVVAVAQFADDYSSRGRSMSKFPITYVDTNMGYTSACSVEEH